MKCTRGERHYNQHESESGNPIESSRFAELLLSLLGWTLDGIAAFHRNLHGLQVDIVR
jgi:hypothetical protein